MQNIVIFPEESLPSPKSTKPFSEPNWSYLFFLKYKPEFHQKILDFSLKTENSYAFFLQGLSKEYGILTRKNLNLALLSYKQGAEHNDPFCHYKLFFIYNEDSQKYHIKRNKDLAISHLVQSAAFWDCYSPNNSLLSHFSPKSVLGSFLENEDEKLVKIRLLIHKFFKNNQMKYGYLNNWIMIEYPFEEDLADFHFNELIIFAENSEYPEACFYYGNYLKEAFCKEKSNDDLFRRSQELLLTATKANIAKAHFPLSQLYEEANFPEEAIQILKKGAKLGCFSCLNSLSFYYSIGLKKGKNLTKALKYAYNSFILGDLTAGHTYFDIGTYIKSIGLEDTILHRVGSNVYLLAKCYKHGINCDIDMKKASEMIDLALKDQKIEDDKYLIYTKARLQAKMGENSHEFNRKAFIKYENFVKNEKNRKFPQHYYRIGKFLQNGWGVEKNDKLAREFYMKGAICVEEKANMCWMQFLYQQKCRNRARDLEKFQ